jgi:Asp/Glu/hydantoin racemase
MSLTRRRLLVVNPNTNANVTAWLAAEARRIAGDEFEVIAVNARSGLAAIETPWDIEIAGRAVAAEVAKHEASGAIVAAFGDPGLAEARALGRMPVVGLGECGMRAAARSWRRFSIVTLGAAMRAAITAKLAAMGFAGQLDEIRLLPFSISELTADRDARRAEIVAAVRACRDRVVLLGGAPFAGMAREIEPESGKIVLDGVEAGVAALALALR